MSALEKGLTIGEVVKFELPLNYNREAITFVKNTGATADLEIGTVLETDATYGWKVVATPANAKAILLEKVPVEKLVADNVKALALMRGPAIVDKDNLYVGNANRDSVATALTALGIICRAEPTKQSVGL